MTDRETHESVERDFAANVRQLRQQRGWSLKDVVEKLAAEGFEMSVSNYSKLETAQKPIRIAEAAAVSAVFGLPPLSMFYGPAEDDQLERELLAKQESLDGLKRQMDTLTVALANTYADVIAISTKIQGKEA